MPYTPSPSAYDTAPAKVACGDTRFCAECLSHLNHRDETTTGKKLFTVNALGRCDFYQGPDSVRVPV